MTRQEKIERSKFLIENLGNDLMNTAKNILTDHTLDDDKIINILLEYYNRGATLTKILYPCILCNNNEIDCIACDELVNEIESYKK